MNHAARHLCINSAQYTLANTNNRRINNKLDTRCVGTKNGLEMKPNQTKVTNKNATPQTSQHQTHRSGFRVRFPPRRDPVPVQRERLEGVGGSNLFGERKKVNGRTHRPASGDLHEGWSGSSLAPTVFTIVYKKLNAVTWALLHTNISENTVEAPRSPAQP